MVGRPFSVYIHVPFCAKRCGYCDFNTYTATELGGGASQATYVDSALTEIGMAAREFGGRAPVRGLQPPNSALTPELGDPAALREVDTVFFGGGTPTLLASSDLIKMLNGVRDTWGLAAGAEVTTEANPDSVDRDYLAALAAAGFTRVSFGMQSAVPHVLKTLDRTHTPERVPQVVNWAREVGLEVSLDLIYGTPGESLDDWRCSLDAALDMGVEHLSAYALGVEPGTKMGAQIRRGEIAAPDSDVQAEMYEIADEVLTAAGLEWYEISNWAKPGHECRHNLHYWRGDDWWGIGPGAHSYLAGNVRWSSGDGAEVTGTRWWNVKHPRKYAQMLAEGELPIEDSETLTAADDALEQVMLRLRLRDGLPLDALTDLGRAAVPSLVSQGLVSCAQSQDLEVTHEGPATSCRTRVVLTRRGRLLADAVTQSMLD